MATARIDLTLDCADATLVADFWKLALGYEDEPPPPPFTTREEWLDHYEVPEDERAGGEWIHDPAGVGPRIAILAVPEPKVAKNRLHIDVRVGGPGTPDERWARISAESDRLAAAGATVLEPFQGHHIVMADPEGNEFCVC
jgi:hypothetical protein